MEIRREAAWKCPQLKIAKTRNLTLAVKCDSLSSTVGENQMLHNPGHSELDKRFCFRTNSALVLQAVATDLLPRVWEDVRSWKRALERLKADRETSLARQWDAELGHALEVFFAIYTRWKIAQRGLNHGSQLSGES